MGPICLWPGVQLGFGEEETEVKSEQVTVFEKPALAGTYSETTVVWRNLLFPQAPQTVSAGANGAQLWD